MRISDWSSDVCSSDLPSPAITTLPPLRTDTIVVPCHFMSFAVMAWYMGECAARRNRGSAVGFVPSSSAVSGHAGTAQKRREGHHGDKSGTSAADWRPPGPDTQSVV